MRRGVRVGCGLGTASVYDLEGVQWPPEPASECGGDRGGHEGAHDERVDQQAYADGHAQLADHAQVADDHRHHGEREYQAGGGDHAPGGAHAADDAGVEAGVDLLLEPRDHQQVVVRTHGEQDHDRQGDHDPLQAESQDVLPQQPRQSTCGAQRGGDGGDDDQGGYHAAGDQQHDREDQDHRADAADPQVDADTTLHLLL